MKNILILATMLIMLTASAYGVDISSCQTLDTEGAIYDLTDNITTSANANCLTISNNSITLDCNNNYINKSGFGAVIYINNFNDTVIKNCNFYGGQYGINNYGLRTNITNNDVIDASTTGINLIGENTTITNNNIINNSQYGIKFTISSNNYLEQNTIYGSSNNVYSDASSLNNEFVNNQIGESYNADISFSQYSGSFDFDEVTSPAANPGKLSLNNYIDVDSSGWIYMNFEYNQSVVDSNDINESTIQIYHYNGTWNPVSGSIDTNNNIVSANLTSFSPFGLFGNQNSGSGATSIPEFSDYAIIFIILTAIGGFFMVKKRNKPNYL